MTVDFAKTAADYDSFRPPFHPTLFQRLAAFDIGLPDQRILDVGAGTGLLGRDLSARGARVIECDASVDLLRHADGTARIAARAEQLPFADHAFDAVTSAQSWHWFDRRIAPRELKRVLKPKGRIAIVYQTYLPIDGNIAHAGEKLILQFRPSWRHAGGVGINGQALKDLQTAGFADVESFSFDTQIDCTRQSWRGFIRTCSAVGPSLSPADLILFDQEHARLLENWPESFEVPHRVFAAVATRP